MTKYEDKKEQPVFKDADHKRPIRSIGELIHEFTNLITAVTGYSELALHAIEDSHPAREWLEKLRRHTRELGALLEKLIALKQSKRGEKL